VEISRKTMGGWLGQCAQLLEPLYQAMKKELFGSKVIGTDDTSVKVLDRKLPSRGSDGSGHTSETLITPSSCTTTRRRDRGLVRRNFW